jgi:hypothetical protein
MENRRYADMPLDELLALAQQRDVGGFTSQQELIDRLNDYDRRTLRPTTFAPAITSPARGTLASILNPAMSTYLPQAEVPRTPMGVPRLLPVNGVIPQVLDRQALTSLTIPVIKQLLLERGIRTDGLRLKADLINRYLEEAAPTAPVEQPQQPQTQPQQPQVQTVQPPQETQLRPLFHTRRPQPQLRLVSPPVQHQQPFYPASPIRQPQQQQPQLRPVSPPRTPQLRPISPPRQPQQQPQLRPVSPSRQQQTQLPALSRQELSRMTKQDITNAGTARGYFGLGSNRETKPSMIERFLGFQSQQQGQRQGTQAPQQQPTQPQTQLRPVSPPRQTQQQQPQMTRPVSPPRQVQHMFSVRELERMTTQQIRDEASRRGFSIPTRILKADLVTQFIRLQNAVERPQPRPLRPVSPLRLQVQQPIRLFTQQDLMSMDVNGIRELAAQRGYNIPRWMAKIATIDQFLRMQELERRQALMDEEIDEDEIPDGEYEDDVDDIGDEYDEPLITQPLRVPTIQPPLFVRPTTTPYVLRLDREELSHMENDTLSNEINLLSLELGIQAPAPTTVEDAIETVLELQDRLAEQGRLYRPTIPHIGYTALTHMSTQQIRAVGEPRGYRLPDTRSGVPPIETFMAQQRAAEFPERMARIRQQEAREEAPARDPNRLFTADELARMTNPQIREVAQARGYELPRFVERNGLIIAFLREQDTRRYITRDEANAMQDYEIRRISQLRQYSMPTTQSQRAQVNWFLQEQQRALGAQPGRPREHYSNEYLATLSDQQIRDMFLNDRVLSQLRVDPNATRDRLINTILISQPIGGLTMTGVTQPEQPVTPPRNIMGPRLLPIRVGTTAFPQLPTMEERTEPVTPPRTQRPLSPVAPNAPQRARPELRTYGIQELVGMTDTQLREIFINDPMLSRLRLIGPNTTRNDLISLIISAQDGRRVQPQQARPRRVIHNRRDLEGMTDMQLRGIYMHDPVLSQFPAPGPNATRDQLIRLIMSAQYGGMAPQQLPQVGGQPQLPQVNERFTYDTEVLPGIALIAEGGGYNRLRASDIITAEDLAFLDAEQIRNIYDGRRYPEIRDPNVDIATELLKAQLDRLVRRDATRFTLAELRRLTRDQINELGRRLNYNMENLGLATSDEDLRDRFLTQGLFSLTEPQDVVNTPLDIHQLNRLGNNKVLRLALLRGYYNEPEEYVTNEDITRLLPGINRSGNNGQADTERQLVYRKFLEDQQRSALLDARMDNPNQLQQVLREQQIPNVGIIPWDRFTEIPFTQRDYNTLEGIVNHSLYRIPNGGIHPLLYTIERVMQAEIGTIINILDRLGYKGFAGTFDDAIALIWWAYITNYGHPDRRNTDEVIRWVTSLSVEQLRQLAVGYQPTGTRISEDKASLTFYVLNRRRVNTPVMDDQQLQRYNALMQISPVAVMRLARYLYRYFDGLTPNITTPYRYVALRDRVSVMEPFIVQYNNNPAELAPMMGMIIPVPPGEQYERYYFENIRWYNEVVTRQVNGMLPPPPIASNPTDEDLARYTDTELLEAYGPLTIDTWRDRPTFISTILAEGRLGSHWHFRERRCANDDRVDNSREYNDEDDYSRIKGDPNNPIISYGTIDNYRCYSARELIESFVSIQGEFIFGVPDYLPGDPMDRQFPLASIRQLLTLLQNVRSPVEAIRTLIQTIQAGLIEVTGATARMRVFHRQYLEMDAVKQDIVRRYIANMFLCGMWFRHWSGPPNAYPVQSRRRYAEEQAVVENGVAFCTSIERDYNSAQAMAAHNELLTLANEIDPAFRQWLVDFPRVDNLFTGRGNGINPEPRYGQEKIQEIFELASRARFCLFAASDVMLQSGYFLGQQVLGFNNDEFNALLREYLNAPTQPPFDPSRFQATHHQDPVMGLQLERQV